MHKPMIPPSVGDRFGRLTVMTVPTRGVGRLICGCVCDCGTARTVRCENLRSGKTVSCSCHRRERFEANRFDKFIHGMSDTPEHKIWVGIIARCTNSRTVGYDNYGGRGIRICDRWRYGEGALSGFQAFHSDVGPRPSPEHSIERDDNNGDYRPGNARWATRTEQNRNSRRNVIVEFRGQILPLPVAIERWGRVSLKCAQGRIRTGWSSERAILTPARGASQ